MSYNILCKVRLMKNLRTVLFVLLIGAGTAVSLMAPYAVRAATPEDLNKDSDHALHMLTSTTPLAADLVKQAKAVLIFPNIIKAGLIFGGAYGEGELKKRHGR
jgi:lipid-binding SYLF domain-containing protein